MPDPQTIDGVLVQWGDRLFNPGNRAVRDRTPRLRDLSQRHRANAIRQRITDTVVRRAPQVMVKVTGGGRGMKAIAAHLRYISKHGRLDIEDDRGQSVRGQDAVHDLAREWRYSGSYIGDTSERREAFNIMLSMPRGTADGLIVQRAAREFAQAELADHKYVMVLHDHQLKLESFGPAHVGQMELYLRWLDKNERAPGEEAPIGLILCASADAEQVELLQLDAKAIRVSEYLTALPSLPLLRERLHQAIEHAREQAARRPIPPTDDE